MFFTTNQTLTPAEILDRYQAQAVLEELFFQERRPLYSGRGKYPSPEETEGKRFAAWLSAILLNELHRLLHPYLQTHTLSLNSALAQLRSIVLASGKEVSRLVRDLTQEQQKILDKLGMTDRLLQSIADLR